MLQFVCTALNNVLDLREIDLSISNKSKIWKIEKDGAPQFWKIDKGKLCGILRIDIEYSELGIGYWILNWIHYIILFLFGHTKDMYYVAA